MKGVILSTLFLILIISSALFYDKYFKKPEETEKLVIDNPVKSVDKKKSNFIKNLEYEISTIDQNKYKITSESSEITYEDGQELILMNKVKAILNTKTKDIDYLFFINAEKELTIILIIIQNLRIMLR